MLPDGHPERRRAHASLLWLFALLFLLRVLGQALVAFVDISFLPPMEAWYSGLMPYPILLPAQLLILALLGKICLDFSRGSGFFVRPRPTVGRFVQAFSFLYFAAMALRYVVTMAFHPERRWFGGTIPIVFHWVLAAYLFTFAQFHTRPDSPARTPGREAAARRS